MEEKQVHATKKSILKLLIFLHGKSQEYSISRIILYPPKNNLISLDWAVEFDREWITVTTTTHNKKVTLKLLIFLHGKQQDSFYF